MAGGFGENGRRQLKSQRMSKAELMDLFCRAGDWLQALRVVGGHTTKVMRPLSLTLGHSLFKSSKTGF